MENPDHDLIRVKLIGLEIQKVLVRHSAGQSHPGAIRQIRVFCDEAVAASGNHPFVTARRDAIISYAERVYSGGHQEEHIGGVRRVREALFAESQLLVSWDGK